MSLTQLATLCVKAFKAAGIPMKQPDNETDSVKEWKSWAARPSADINVNYQGTSSGMRVSEGTRPRL